MKKRVFIFLAAAALVAAFAFYGHRKVLKVKTFQSSVLAPQLRRSIRAEKHSIVFTERKADCVNALTQEGGAPSFAAERFYLPPEGHFIYEETLSGRSKLSVKNYGLTFKPFGGGAYCLREGFSPLFGARFFYAGRWGAGLAYAGNSGLLFSAQRRLDEFCLTENTALFFGVNKNTAAFGAVVFL